jgi:hypothetical protein
MKISHSIKASTIENERVLAVFLPRSVAYCRKHLIRGGFSSACCFCTCYTILSSMALVIVLRCSSNGGEALVIAQIFTLKINRLLDRPPIYC